MSARDQFIEHVAACEECLEIAAREDLSEDEKALKQEWHFRDRYMDAAEAL